MKELFELLSNRALTEVVVIIVVLTFSLILVLFVFGFFILRMKIKRVSKNGIEIDSDFATKDDFTKLEKRIDHIEKTGNENKTLMAKYQAKSDAADRITLDAVYVILDCMRGELINGNVTGVQKNIFNFLNGKM